MSPILLLFINIFQNMCGSIPNNALYEESRRVFYMMTGMK